MEAHVKGGQRGWSQIIPVWAYYTQGEVANKPNLGLVAGILLGVSVIFEFIKELMAISLIASLVSFALWIIIQVNLSKKYDAGVGRWLIFILLPFIGVFLVSKTNYIETDDKTKN